MLAESISYDRRVDIQKISDLPPLPVIANELLAALNNPDAEIEDISNIIIKDPGLTAKLLGLANSAFFSFGRQVDSVTGAIINVLGLELVKGLSVGLIMSNSFDCEKCKSFDISRYWSNAILSASLTRELCKIGNLDQDFNPGYFYLYGLLHNIGILVLTDCFPDEMNEVFLAHEKEPDRKLVAIENEVMGIDHHSASGHLAAKWNLPEDVCISMRHHADSQYFETYSNVAQLTGYSSRMAQHWLDESPVEDRDELIPTLLKLPLDKHEKIIEASKNKIADVSSIAASMCN